MTTTNHVLALCVCFFFPHLVAAACFYHVHAWCSLVVEQCTLYMYTFFLIKPFILGCPRYRRSWRCLDFHWYVQLRFQGLEPRGPSRRGPWEQGCYACFTTLYSLPVNQMSHSAQLTSLRSASSRVTTVFVQQSGPSNARWLMIPPAL